MKRESGNYWCKLISGRWVVAEWVYATAIAEYWEICGSKDSYQDSDFEEIDETRITRDKKESPNY